VLAQKFYRVLKKMINVNADEHGALTRMSVRADYVIFFKTLESLYAPASGHCQGRYAP